MKKNRLFKCLLAGLLVLPLASCNAENSSQTTPPISSNDDSSPEPEPSPSPEPEPEPEPEEVVTKLTFDISLSKHIDLRYNIGVLVESNNYAHDDILVLQSQNDRGHFVGTFESEEGFSFKENDASKFEVKFAVIDAKSSEVLSDSYISDIYSLEFNKELTFTLDLEMNLPSSGLESYFITSIYDADNKDEDITNSSMRYLTYTDEKGNTKSPNDFAIGDKVYVRYASPKLMDGRQVINKAVLGVNSLETVNLEFEKTGDEKNPVYISNFIKTEKDVRLKLYIASEFLLGIEENSKQYISKVEYLNSNNEKVECNIDEITANPIYIRKNTKFTTTLISDIGQQSARIVGTKINSPDSYAYESGYLYSAYSFTTNLTGNDQLITILLDEAISVNVNRDDFIKKEIINSWRHSEYTNPNQLIDGKIEKGFDNWNDYFVEDKDMTLTLNYDKPHPLSIRNINIYWFEPSDKKDALKPEKLEIYYKVLGSEEYVKCEYTDSIYKEGYPLTTVDFGDKGVKDIVSIKVVFNGPVGKWSNFAELETITVGKKIA